jgi:hypothetical protein
MQRDCVRCLPELFDSAILPSAWDGFPVGGFIEN